MPSVDALPVAICVDSIFKREPTYYTAYGIGVYLEDWEIASLRLNDVTCFASLRKNGVVVVADAPPTFLTDAAKLRDKGYKPICAFGGGFRTFLCVLCTKTSPFDGRRLFCPIGDMW